MLHVDDPKMTQSSENDPKMTHPADPKMTQSMKHQALIGLVYATYSLELWMVLVEAKCLFQQQ